MEPSRFDNFLLRFTAFLAFLGFLRIVNAVAGPFHTHPHNPTITPPPDPPPPDIVAFEPELARRQNGYLPGTNFIGWAEYYGTWYPISCGEGSTITESSAYAACRPTNVTAFTIATTCVTLDGSAYMVEPSTSFPCGGTSVCYSIEIFSSVGDPSPRMGYACDSTSVEFVSVYVELVPTTTVSSTSSTTSSTSSAPTSSTSPASSSGSPSSQAWIAGPVIGAIAAVAIIGLLVWIVLLLRRRRPPPEKFQTKPPMLQEPEEFRQHHNQAPATPFSQSQPQSQSQPSPGHSPQGPMTNLHGVGVGSSQGGEPPSAALTPLQYYYPQFSTQAPPQAQGQQPGGGGGGGAAQSYSVSPPGAPSSSPHSGSGQVQPSQDGSPNAGQVWMDKPELPGDNPRTRAPEKW